MEFAENSILGNFAEITIGLGANEVVGGDREGNAWPGLRLGSVDKSQRRQGVDDEPGFHVFFSFRFPFTRLSGGAFHVPSNARTRVGQGLRAILEVTTLQLSARSSRPHFEPLRLDRFQTAP